MKFSRFRLVAMACAAIMFSWLLACNSDYTIKRKGYFKIHFPQHQYQVYDKPGVPYTFEYPTYAHIVQDTSFFDQKPENPYWANVEFPEFHGKIYISYKEIGNRTLDTLINDAYKMTYQHTSRATEIQDSLMITPQGLHGIFFTVHGNAATAKQFFVTDSSKHFLRGALYFDATPNEDSLGIVNDFLETDMQHLINTLRWR